MRADAAERLPFADGQFDLAYCSSVIEHVPRERRRRPSPRELRRDARGWYVQTPARSVPEESSRISLLPGAHWLPGGALAASTPASWCAAGGWEDVALLGRAELEGLFGPAEPERFGPLTKSWVCVRAPLSR